MVSRRHFIRAGLFGGALLAVVAALRRTVPQRSSGPPIDSDGESVIAAIAAVLLKGVRGSGRDDERHIVEGVKQAVAMLSAPAQQEIGELFGLLSFAPTRVAVARVAAPWRQASESEIAAFLQSWRTSRIGLLQSGYQALHDLVMGAWYADAGTWAAIGYAGPPALRVGGP